MTPDLRRTNLFSAFTMQCLVSLFTVAHDRAEFGQ